MKDRVQTAVRRMKAHRFPSSEQLSGRIPPAPVWRLDEALGEATVVAAPKVKQRSVRRRVVLVGGLVAAVGAAAFLAPAALTGGTAYAATPSMLTFEPSATPATAAEVLTDLAARARTQQFVGASGRYHYQHRRSWDLAIVADTKDEIIQTGILEVDREQWIADDGSGRLKVNDGTPAAPNRTYAPGELAAGFLAESTPPQAIHSLLDRKGSAVGWLRAASDLWKRQVMSPQLHASLLAVLASRPDISVMGYTTDRAGRRGVAIGADDDGSLDERIVLVFSPETGALLAAESIVLESNGLPVRAPATVGYTVWVTTGFTATTERVP